MILLRPKPQLATSPLPSLDCGSVDKADGSPATCFDLTISAIEIAGFFQAETESLVSALARFLQQGVLIFPTV